MHKMHARLKIGKEIQGISSNTYTKAHHSAAIDIGYCHCLVLGHRHCKEKLLGVQHCWLGPCQIVSKGCCCLLTLLNQKEIIGARPTYNFGKVFLTDTHTTNWWPGEKVKMISAAGCWKGRQSWEVIIDTLDLVSSPLKQLIVIKSNLLSSKAIIVIKSNYCHQKQST